MRSLPWRWLLVPAVVLAIAIAAAPAAWLADRVAAGSRWRLVHPSGTVWRGTALVGLADGPDVRVLPGRLAWRVTALRPLAGEVALSLTHPAVDNPVDITAAADGVQVGAGGAHLPAALLAAAGAPFNTLHPGGRLALAWTALRISGGSLVGRIDLAWEDAASALATVAPLGSYRLRIEGRGARGEVRLGTTRGPLRLEGSGGLDRGRLRFAGTAQAEADWRDPLDGLLGALGRRAGDRVVLDWETTW